MKSQGNRADNLTEPSARKRHAPRLALLAAALAWVVVANWLYQPLAAGPFEMIDFPEFFSVLGGSTSVWDSIRGMTKYNMTHGRFNPATMGAFAVQWHLFGQDMLGWKVVRFVTMCVVAWLAYLIIHRLGGSRLGAFSATLIVLASPVAAVGWTRLSAPEPVSAVLLVLLIFLMLGSPRGASDGTRLLLVGFAVLLIGLVKEIVICAVPPIVIASWAYSSRGSLSLKSLLFDSRVRVAAVACLLVSLVSVWVALRAPSDSYARDFGSGASPGLTFAMAGLATLIPLAPAQSWGSPLSTTAIVIYLAGVVAGWGLLMKKPRPRSISSLLTLAVSLPVVGAAAYAPWPSYRTAYASPFLIGTMLLLGLAISRLEATARHAKVLIVAGGLLILVPMLAFSHSYARFVSNSLKLTRDVALHIGSLPGTASVRFEVCGANPQLWGPVFGQLVARYARTLSLHPPRVVDAPCTGAQNGESSRETWRFVVSTGAVGHDQEDLSRMYAYQSVDLRSLRVRSDTLSFAIWIPRP